ncbi:MAG TPA: M48 family metalloprotease [Candidatus Paceibacterota bacterium]|nr:M48 family metalloprotease [Candidatus Paceibacterota bacterium]HQJ83798.1 M48 family metalloprotease [Candidatus Paceibacterota bacterium]
MATLYTEQDKNTRRTWLLMAGFLAVIVALGWFISDYYNNSAILYAAIIFSVSMNVASYWWSDKIALSLNGAKEVPRDENVELHRLVENLAITAGLPKPRVYVIEDLAPNAFATGRDKNHAAVAVTRGLLNMLDKNELEGVVAHELAHIGNRDILLQTVVVVLVGFVAIISDMFMRLSFSGGDRDRNRGGNLLAIVGVVFVILSPIIATLIQLAISRQREFLADSSGALLTRYPEGLANALQKISGYGGTLKRANNATAHMFIANPFGPKAARGVSKLFMTHPPVEERIKALVGGKTKI